LIAVLLLHSQGLAALDWSDQKRRTEHGYQRLQLYDDGTDTATASINHERSPLLLITDEDRDTWLDGTPAEAAALVKPISGDVLRIVQEKFDKKDLLSDQGAL
jgi:hypothetical protein